MLTGCWLKLFRAGMVDDMNDFNAAMSCIYLYRHVDQWFWTDFMGSVVQITQCASRIPHNAPLCNRNQNTCAHFYYKMALCGLIVWCIVEFERSNGPMRHQVVYQIEPWTFISAPIQRRNRHSYLLPQIMNNFWLVPTASHEDWIHKINIDYYTIYITV